MKAIRKRSYRAKIPTRPIQKTSRMGMKRKTMRYHRRRLR